MPLSTLLAELSDADSDILIIRLRLLAFMPNNAALKLEKARAGLRACSHLFGAFVGMSVQSGAYGSPWIRSVHLISVVL